MIALTSSVRPLSPMRPGINLGAAIPRDFRLPGWEWQPKVNEERAVLHVPLGPLYNRHGALLDRRKADHYNQIVEELRIRFRSHEWLDLGLIGFRDSETFRAARGAVIVFDVPMVGEGTTWEERRTLLTCLPVLEIGETPVAGLAYRLPETHAAGELFERTRGVPGLEGIVGRLLASPYNQGDSRSMAKARWLKG